MLKNLLPVFNLIEEEIYKYKFTVFVPVYNAAETISLVFDSLNAQTFKDFEVIIINDGSSDNSHEVINSKLPDLSFDHTYINNIVNVNKFGILFEAVEKAKGEFFIIHDSDDQCTSNALETFLRQYNSIPSELKDKISGVTCKCKNQFGEEIGAKLPADPLYSNTFESSIKYGLSFEKWGLVKTRLLKSIKIDKFIVGKGMIPESFIWMIFAKNKFLTKYCSDVIRIYFVDNQNSLSTLKYDKKALGMGLYAIMFMNYFYEDYLLVYPKHFIKRLVSLLMASKYLKYTFKDYYQSIDSVILKIIFSVLWPFKSFL
ncbi:glycosyltransferase family 2 protein [Maribacter aquivivus]|nr:glycosyltransferase family 2 protein [Maribacter aquivivus]